MSNGLIAAFVTTPNEELARRLARALIEKGLVACVNIIPGIKSMYRWEGKIMEDSEQLLMIKTAEGQLPSLTALVKSMHTYSVPEVIAISIVGGNQQYLDWVRESTVRKE